MKFHSLTPEKAVHYVEVVADPQGGNFSEVCMRCPGYRRVFNPETGKTISLRGINPAVKHEVLKILRTETE